MRKKLKRSHPKNVIIGFKITRQQGELLKKWAKWCGTSVHDAARGLVLQALMEDERQKRERLVSAPGNQ